MENKKKKLFISYTREDIEIAKKIYKDLKIAGTIPWIDCEDLLPGQNWETEICKAINDCHLFLALHSSNWVEKKRGFVHKELKVALDILDEHLESEIFVIPIRLDDCETKNEELKKLQWIDLNSETYDQNFPKLLEAINRDKAELKQYHSGKIVAGLFKNEIFTSENSKSTFWSIPSLVFVIFFLIVGSALILLNAIKEEKLSSVRGKPEVSTHSQEKPIQQTEKPDAQPLIKGDTIDSSTSKAESKPVDIPSEYKISEHQPKFIKDAQTSLSVIFQNLYGENFVSLNIAPKGRESTVRAVLNGYTEEFESSTGVYIVQILSIDYGSRQVVIMVSRKS